MGMGQVKGHHRGDDTSSPASVPHMQGHSLGFQYITVITLCPGQTQELLGASYETVMTPF